MITIDLKIVIKYLILLGIGLIGSKYKTKNKREQFGELIGKGNLIKHRTPINKICNFLYVIMINSGFIWNSISNDNVLLTIGFSIAALSNILIIIYDLYKNRNNILIYENGIEIDNEEILYEKMDSYKKNDKDEYTVKRKWHRDIIYKIMEVRNIEETKIESREEIFMKAFPELFNKDRKI